MASITALVDDFTTQNSTLWYWDAGTSATGGRLSIPCTTNYRTVTTNAGYDLTGASAFCQVVSVPNQGAGGTSAKMMVGKDTSNAFMFRHVNGTLRFIELVFGSESDATQITYSATDHAWWRIRHAAGTIYWETSPDGNTWTIRRQKAPASANTNVTAMYVQFQCGYTGTETTPGTLLVDNFNVAPAPTSTGAFFSFFDLAGADEPSAEPTVQAPTARLEWMDPRYFVVGMGTQTISTASYFAGTVDSYSLVGAPTGVSIDPTSGVISATAATAFEWTTVGVRATNSGGFAEATIDLWCFTPNKTVAAGAAWSTVTPAPGDIVVVRGGTYTARQNISTWDGTASQRTRIVAYPGETVTFSNIEGYSIETNGANYVELRGFTFSDNGTHNFGLWNNQVTGFKLAQCMFTGYLKAGICIGQGTEANAAPWIIEYCRFTNNVQENKNFNALAAARGCVIDYCDGSLVRRNRFYRNYGEGLGFVGSSNCTVEQNISYDNCSVNIYLDNCQNFEIHSNIVWSNDPAYYTQGRVAASIRAANEDYNGTGGTSGGGKEQPTTGLNVTNNRYLSGNEAPGYMGTYGDGGGAGTSVFTPNSTFTTVESVWR